MAATSPADNALVGMLPLEISNEAGRGEGSMGDFVQEHFASILRPFAGHLDQLHKSVAQLSDKLHETTLVSGDNSIELANDAKLIAAMRMDLDRLGRRGDAFDVRIDGLTKDRDSIKQDVEQVRGSFKTLDHQHRATVESISKLREDFKVSGLRADKQASELAAVADVIEAKVAKVEAGLRVRHSQLEQAAQAAVELARRQAAEERSAAEEALRKLNDLFARRGREDSKRLEQLESATSRLEKMAKSNKDHIEREGMKAESAMRAAADARQHADVAGRATTALEHRKVITEREVKALQTRLSSAEESIETLISNLDLTQGVKIGRIFDSLSDLDTATKEAKAGVEACEIKLRGQGARLEEEAANSKKVHSDLKEQLEQHSRMLKAALNLDEDADRLEAEAKEAKMAADRKETQDRLSSLERSLASMDDRLTQRGRQLDDASGRVEGLERTLSATGDRVAKLSGSLDLTQEYWKGLQRGLRETHRTVAVDRELLPDPPPPPAASPALVGGLGGGVGGASTLGAGSLLPYLSPPKHPQPMSSSLPAALAKKAPTPGMATHADEVDGR